MNNETRLTPNQQDAINWWVDINLQARRNLGHQATIDDYDAIRKNFYNSVAEKVLQGATGAMTIVDDYNDPARREEREREVPGKIAKEIDRETRTRYLKRPETYAHDVLEGYAARLRDNNQRG